MKLDADFSGKQLRRIDQSIAMGALFTAHHLGAKAIVALTESGSTPLWMSRHRAHIPMYALTSRLATQRKMALYRNVRPLLMDSDSDRDTALAQAEAHLKKRGIVQAGDIYAITCGEPMGAPGGTNMLKICRVDVSSPPGCAHWCASPPRRAERVMGCHRARRIEAVFLIHP